MLKAASINTTTCAKIAATSVMSAITANVILSAVAAVPASILASVIVVVVVVVVGVMGEVAATATIMALMMMVTSTATPISTVNYSSMRRAVQESISKSRTITYAIAASTAGSPTCRSVLAGRARFVAAMAATRKTYGYDYRKRRLDPAHHQETVGLEKRKIHRIWICPKPEKRTHLSLSCEFFKD
ncbi:hypothetical protein NL676_000989 [Syzygium grande]|nr:hypothetical protein NL676_000989 [Syzygium grande]